MKIELDNLIPVLDSDIDFSKETETLEDIKTEDNENVDVKEELTDNKTEETSTSDDTPEPSKSATIFYKELAANGIGQDDKDEYTFDDVNALLKDYTDGLPTRITNSIIDATPEHGKKAIDYIFAKGENLSKEDLKEFINTYLDELSTSDITIDSDDKARQVLEQEYKKQGWKPNVIESILDTLEDDGDLQKEAKKFIETKPNKSDELIQSVKEQNEQVKQAQAAFIDSINSEFETLNWDKRRINKVKSDLISGKTAEILAEAGRNPKALIQLADFADYFDTKTKTFNFDKFIEKLNSKEARSLKDKIEQDMFSSTPPTKSTKLTNSSKFDELTPIV